jgi:hypothetical protein
MNRRVVRFVWGLVGWLILAVLLVAGVPQAFRVPWHRAVLGAVIVSGVFFVFAFVMASIQEARVFWWTLRWWWWSRRMGRWVTRRDALLAEGRCTSCAYDLTGNVSGVCPECGLGKASLLV